MLQPVFRNGLIFMLCAAIVLAQEAALTNDVVIKMVLSGAPTGTIVRMVETAERVSFRFLPNDLAEMAQAKVPEEVFKAMARRDKTLGPAPGQSSSPAKAEPARTTTPVVVAVAARPAAVVEKSSIPVTAPSGKGYEVKYSGGSLESVKSGEDLRLFVASEHIALRHGKADALSLSPSSITDLSYGQEVHRRIGAAAGVAVLTLGVGAIIAFSKSKKHYIGITWDDSGKKGGVALQADKNEYRGILTALEGVTGRKAVDTDEDAAKKNK